MRHGATMRRVAYSFVSDEAVADEVVQEAWLAVVTLAETVPIPG